MLLNIVASNLVRFGVQMILFFLMMGYYFIHNASFTITPAIVLFPVLVLLVALLVLVLGLIITALFTKYGDLAFLVTFGIQHLMYTTTVIYPLSSAPEKYITLISLNTMTGILRGL